MASGDIRIELPPETAILSPPQIAPLANPRSAILAALDSPIGTPPFSTVARQRLGGNKQGGAVIVISDSTRPVPYSGPSDILWPLVEQLLGVGYHPENICILVATGTHRSMSEREILGMIDPRVAGAGLTIRTHDAFSDSDLVVAGVTHMGHTVRLDRRYLEADFRILTGLVETHFMAGTSGGRKSICPGLVDIDSLREFHGPDILADPCATDLVTEGNPCHEFALEVAQMAPAHFILNVTAREDGAVTGVFAGDMIRAHNLAVENLRGFAEIPLAQRYDVVVTHAGKVGINHYQVAKAASVAARAVKKSGFVIVVADTTDSDPIGSPHYRALLAMLREVGSAAFEQLLRSSDWTFVPDQWEVQMWARLFSHIDPSHLLYFSPQTPLFEYERLPCRSPHDWAESVRGLDRDQQYASFARRALELAIQGTADDTPGAEAIVAYLPAGPYAIPVALADERTG